VGSFFVFPQPLTYEQQLCKLESHGLVIHDCAFALQCLRKHNYYRLRGYWLTFEREKHFISGTLFEDIWDVYQFDSELRKWLCNALEPIEIELRAQFSYVFSHAFGCMAYLDSSYFNDAQKHLRAIKNYKRECERDYRLGVPCVVHNMDKYGELPLWAAVEIMSFGTVSQFFGNLRSFSDDNAINEDVTRDIALAFGIKYRYLRGWVHHLVTVRNLVAHHSRFYNRTMNIRPLMLKQDARYASLKQFPTFLVIKRMYERSCPEAWPALLDELTACFERHEGVDLRPMGFPKDWRNVLSL
jgi:abortive infection bacteriophage resistance protein